jgi:hypothetical protein
VKPWALLRSPQQTAAAVSPYSSVAKRPRLRLTLPYLTLPYLTHAYAYAGSVMVDELDSPVYHPLAVLPTNTHRLVCQSALDTIMPSGFWNISMLGRGTSNRGVGPNPLQCPRSLSIGRELDAPLTIGLVSLRRGSAMNTIAAGDSHGPRCHLSIDGVDLPVPTTPPTSVCAAQLQQETLAVRRVDCVSAITTRPPSDFSPLA